MHRFFSPILEKTELNSSYLNNKIFDVFMKNILSKKANSLKVPVD